MVGFGGWEMPVAYADGTIAEHLACREDAVVFDVSHLGTVRLDAPGAFDRLQDVLTSDLARIAPGRTQYAHLLEESGGVADDVIVWWVAPDRFDVMPNASNTDRVTGALLADGPGGPAAVEVRDTTAERAVLAIQGPNARERLATFAPDAAAVGRFRVAPFSFAGADCVVAGTGYTGGDGVECAVPVAVAADFWTAVTGAGVTPAGLGARDTLRLEAALPLHRQELGVGITPLNAGLGWVVGWDKESFRGRSALLAQQEAGVDPVLRAIRTEGRRPPRAGHEVVVDGSVVGRVTSGNFSPVLGCGIALAYTEPQVGPGDGVTLRGPNAELVGECVEPPFVRA